LKQLKDLENKYNAKQLDVEKINNDLDEIKRQEADVNRNVEDAEKRLKNLTSDFDRFAKLAAQKRWKLGDAFRNLPVIDAFASPTRIDQIVLESLPIDYNFKHVTRYDRCTTCHQGIDRAAFAKQTLVKLTQDLSDGQVQKFHEAIDMLKERLKILDKKAVDFDISDIKLVKKISNSELTDARINQFSAHPHLDLFVDGNSPHPKEKFGCTICHSGQGSATDFNLASHTPNNAGEKARWEEEHNWHANHFWDFPMLPGRFTESSCIKCHHHVLDILPNGEQREKRGDKLVAAPGSKVIKGYNLVRENGCFGCHEIAAIKGGRPVGPDLRLEPFPPLDMLAPGERAKMTADPLNPPGTMRKVGPSLKRVSEKTNQKWARRWLQSPRDFRPDTRMPHFYNLSNNHPDLLPEGQKDFPDAEIHGIAYYLIQESKAYLDGKDPYYRTKMARKKVLEDKKKSNTATEEEKKELVEVVRQLELAPVPTPLREKIITGDGKVVQLPAWIKDENSRNEHAKNGRVLFTEKGCLACHSHSGTNSARDGIPAAFSKADFGPNLSQLAAKIEPEGSDPDGKWRWLVQWILNPNVHFPRTRMPITHLKEEEAAEIASWLLSQEFKDWPAKDPAEPKTESLENLARLYLEKAFGRLLTKEILEKKGLEEAQEKQLSTRAADADELRLAQSRSDEKWEDKLKWYVGRKAISQLGCYACHDIPGYEMAKPIGTPLNDWGKKDPERLAFEDVIAYAKKNYYPVANRDDAKEPMQASSDWKISKDQEGNVKDPYEQFFFEALEHHQRDGFLHQKLMEPRSFDYDRIRSWDDRLRMPQFRFSRTSVTENAALEDKAQAERDEAEAREAVMTFILGLVADPIPLKYLNDPTADKFAITKGKHVLDKFNCAGCHYVQPGMYEFKLNEEMQSYLDSFRVDLKDDHFELFRDQSEWTGRNPVREDQAIIFGMPNPKNPRTILLTEALRYKTQGNEFRDIPASENIDLMPVEENNLFISRMDPQGGAFVNLMVDYLTKQSQGSAANNAYKIYEDYKTARMALPPPLLRQGEKTQPDWLFQFLRDPQPIRPARRLRMPKFNMNEDEAMTLVNYFAAVDKLKNPAGGVVYPYASISQRSDEFWNEKTAQYASRLREDKKLESRFDDLGLIWEVVLKDQLANSESAVAAASAAVARETDPAKKDNAKKALQQAENTRDALLKKVNRLKDVNQLGDGQKISEEKRNLFKEYNDDWQKNQAYSSDAYRVMANVCIKCHSIGNLKADSSEPTQGPPLELTWQRLRPEWTARWIANPKRMISYETPMPANFPKSQVPWPEFHGSNLEQALAVRDFLMFYPKLIDMPANRFYRPLILGEVK
jgi:mono/diheme cytochrome c family protein